MIKAVRKMCNYRQPGCLSLAFGLWLVFSFMFPESIVIIFISLIAIILSILLLKLS